MFLCKLYKFYFVLVFLFNHDDVLHLFSVTLVAYLLIKLFCDFLNPCFLGCNQYKFQAILLRSLPCRHDRTFFKRINVNNILNIYKIHTKLGMEAPFYMLLICTKFHGNQARILVLQQILKSVRKE